MKNLWIRCLGVVLVLVGFLNFQNNIWACNITVNPRTTTSETDKIVFTISGDLNESEDGKWNYKLKIEKEFFNHNHEIIWGENSSPYKYEVTKDSCPNCFGTKRDEERDVKLKNKNGDTVCSTTYIAKLSYDCSYDLANSCIDNGENPTTTIKVNSIKDVNGDDLNNFHLENSDKNGAIICNFCSIPSDEITIKTYHLNFNSSNKVIFTKPEWPGELCSFNIQYKEKCSEEDLLPPSKNERSQEIDLQNCCINGSNCNLGDPTDPNFGVVTALGCIPTNPGPFVGWLLKYAIAMGGGIAFLLMAFGAFTFMSSGGDPEKVKQGKEILTSAIAGLLFIVFAVFLLQLVGVQILKIPGFN